jgi:hypothetical protein
MLKTDANNSKCDAIFKTTAENVRNVMMRSFDETANLVTGELFKKMTKLKTVVVAEYNTPIPNANEAKRFADAVKGAFDADKSIVKPSPNALSATQSNETNATPTQSSVSNTSAPPSNTTQSNTTSATPTQSSATPSNATNATPSSPSNTSATQSSVSSATPSNETSAMPSNTSSPSNTSATQSSVTQSSVKPSPNALSATQSNETSAKNAKNANLNNMPVMKQPPKAVAQPSEVALSPAAGGG